MVELAKHLQAGVVREGKTQLGGGGAVFELDNGLLIGATDTCAAVIRQVGGVPAVFTTLPSFQFEGNGDPIVQANVGEDWEKVYQLGMHASGGVWFVMSTANEGWE